MAAAATPYEVYIGYDGREAVASDVAASSIARHTKSYVKFKYLKHRELRQRGLFRRPWLIEATTGEYRDLLDDRPFSTEFSHTRFLVPELQHHQGWALFMDADMIFTDDIKHLFDLADDKFAVMCVQHQHVPRDNSLKMDGRLQNVYHRKNWSSFVLWNCSHPANRKITKDKVSFAKGADLHSFAWLQDHEIGHLHSRYNYISGISPKLPQVDGKQTYPHVIHYTEGGPWFPECKEVPYADLWDAEQRFWHDKGAQNYNNILYKGDL